MYEAIRIERLGHLKDQLNANPVIRNLTKNLELTAQFLASDGPLAFFLWIKDGQVIEFSEERKPSNIVFWGAMRAWKQVVTGERTFVNALMDKDLTAAFDIRMDQFSPELQKTFKGMDTTLALIDLKTMNAVRLFVKGGSVKLDVIDKVDPEECKKWADHVIEIPREISEKALLYGKLSSFIGPYLRRKIKIRTGIFKLLKQRKLAGAFSFLKIFEVIELIVRSLPLREMA